MARILLVDDDPILRAALARFLVSQGHAVVEQGDGEAAIQAYREQPPDLVLTDAYMPKVDGIETALRLRSEFPDAKIVVMSGGGFRHKTDVLHLATNAGAIATISKPIEFDDLAKLLKEVLGTPG